MSEVPEILYKYRSCESHHLSMLKENKVYLAYPAEFNDPFDCATSEGTFDYYNDETVCELLVKFRGVDPSNLCPDKNRQLFELVRNDPKFIAIAENSEKERKFWREALRIYCLSANPRSILMWSHYANKHTGFCIGFKKTIVDDEKAIKKVFYSDVRPNDYLRQFMDKQGLTQEEAIESIERDLALSKAIDWQYEQEWRIIIYREDKWTGVLSYEPECIDQIIFGLNMSDVDKLKIFLLMKGKIVNFFQAVKSKSKFEIYLEPIDQLNLS